MSQYKRYSKYKPSGVDWIGDIPKEWSIERLASVGIFSSSGIDKKIVEGEPLVSMVNYTDIYGNEARTLKKDREYMVVSCPESKRIEHQVKRGDLVFTPSSETIEDIGLSAVIDEDLPNTVFSYHVVRFIFQQDVWHEYKKYLCNNSFVLNQFSRVAKGTTRQILGRFDFSSTRVVMPLLDDQKAISGFLDQKSARIDDLIQKKEQVIKLLKQKRAGVINQAVTKGLDPKVKMKPSGVDWIGDIPEGWDKKRIKYISKVNSDELPEYTDQNFEFYYIDIGNVTLENGFSRGEKIIFSEAPSRAKRIVKKGDTIVSTVRTYLKAIAYIDDCESDLIASTGFAVIRPEDEIDGKYLYYSLCSERVVNTISAISVGVSYPAINSSDLSGIFLVFPNKYEQKRIADFLDNKMNEIDTLIERIQTVIKKLREYRSSLITAAVTGKIDVRES